MNTVKSLIKDAEEFRKNKNLDDAINSYNDAFNLIIDEAGRYALKIEGENVDKGELRKDVDRVFAHSKVYLKQNLYSAIILNAMGELFMEMEEFSNAQQKFQEAIDYTPEDEEFDEPHKNLYDLAGKMVEVIPENLDE